MRETLNLSTDANRSTDREKKTYKDFSSSSVHGFGWAGVGCCALYSRAQVYMFLHCITLNFFPMQCISLKKIKNMCSFNSQQFNSLDCIEIHCISNFGFAGHCNVLYCTAPLTLHSTVLHLVKFWDLWHFKYILT